MFSVGIESTIAVAAPFPLPLPAAIAAPDARLGPKPCRHTGPAQPHVPRIHAEEIAAMMNYVAPFGNRATSDFVADPVGTHRFCADAKTSILSVTVSSGAPDPTVIHAVHLHFRPKPIADDTGIFGCLEVES